MLEEDKCRLVSGAFALFVQAILGIAAGSTLYIKWRLETPRRPFNVWVFDLSKQAVAGFFSHAMNVLIAAALSGIESSSNVESDECAWYLLNFVFDASFGLPLCWLSIRLLELQARHFGWTSLESSGDYGDPPEFSRWYIQISAWTIVVLVKVILSLPLYIYSDEITKLGMYLFEPLHPYPQVELVLVMVIGPVFINLFQFWMFDQVLKKGGGCALCSTCQKGQIGQDTEHVALEETRLRQVETEPLLANESLPEVYS